MEHIQAFLDLLFSFKAYVMLPFFILVIALLVRMKVGDAIFNSLKLGVGFAGIFVVFDFFIKTIQPAVRELSIVRGLDFPVLDVGWPPLAAITWSSSLAPLTIPLVFVINIIMLATKTTRTLFIDIWNYWHLAMVGALVMSLNSNFWLGLSAVIVFTIYNIKVSDWSGPYLKREMELDGVTIAPVSVVGILPYSVVVNELFERIPLLGKIGHRNIRGKKSSLLVEPMIIGSFMGLVLGIFASYSVKDTLETAIHIAAVMFLLPKCGGLISEAIEPVSLALKQAIVKRFPDSHSLYVAVDTGVLMKENSVMLTGLILMPIALVLALLIPGNKVLPLGDLPNLMSVMSVTVLVCRKNIFRSVILGIPVVAGFLMISSAMASLFTELSAGKVAGVESGQLISAFTDGGHHVRFLLYKAYELNLVALCLIPVLLLMMLITRRIGKQRFGES